MIPSTPPMRRVQTIEEVLSNALRFLRLHFKPLVGGVLAIISPALLVNGISVLIFSESSHGDALALLEITRVITFFSTIVLVQVAVPSYLVLYNDDPTRPISLGELWHNVRFFLGRAFVAFLLYAILSTAGLVFFFLPGVYFIIAGAFAVMSVVQEDCSPFAAISRSTMLTQGYWWPTFGLFLLVCFLQVIIGIIVGMPMTFILSFYVAAFNVLADGGVVSMLSNLISNAIFLIGVFVASLVFAFQYYNLVERREAPGVLERLAALESETEDEAPLSTDDAEEDTSPQK